MVSRVAVTAPLLVLFVLACSSTPAPVDEAGEEAHATPQASADPTLIPRQVLFGDPHRGAVRLSPDGQSISFFAPHEGVRNIWVGPADAPDDAQPVTFDEDRGIQWYHWAHTSEHLLYGQDRDGDENFTLYSLELESGETTRLTPAEEVRASVLALSPDHPEEFLIQLNDRDPRFHDVHRLNLRSGERSLVVENPGFAVIAADSDLQVRMATRQTADGGYQWFVPTDDTSDTDSDGGTEDHEGQIPPGWTLIETISLEDSMTTYVARFEQGTDRAFAVDSRARDTGALVGFDFPDGEPKVLHADPRADVQSVVFHPTRNTPQAAAVIYERREWAVLDEAIADDMLLLQGLYDADLHILSRTADDDRWLVFFEFDDRPGRYYVYDRERGEADFLFVNYTVLEGVDLTPMTPVVIEARDGLEMVSYLTVPEGAQQPMPLVLLVHGGPWWRDHWGYNAEHQWLADRGYAVLSVNFRGSTGFGKEFLNAGNLEWGAAMHDDLIDAVQWAIDQGITNSDQVAIMGGSYGGYATLAGLTFTPETFACGVNIVGISNLITLLESVPPYWEPLRAMFAARVGDLSTEEGRQLLRERSPLTQVDQIQRPLLIGHGAHDPRVTQAEADQIVDAMTERNIPVTYVLYPDEGHGFHRPANRISFNAITEAFLADCLGGNFEPIGDDFDGASLQILQGIDEVPGVGEALNTTE